MDNKSQKLITHETQVIFETVYEGKQGVGIIENGVYRFVEGSLARYFAYNKAYFVTNLAVAKRLAKDILGSSYAAPYIFLDMVWVPIQIYNRSVILYIALHHIERVDSVSKYETLVDLRYGVRLKLDVSRGSLCTKLLVSCFLKVLLDGRKQFLGGIGHVRSDDCEIVKEQGSVYYTKKRQKLDDE